MKYKYGQKIKINHPFYGEQEIIVDDYLEGTKENSYLLIFNIKERNPGLSGTIGEFVEKWVDEKEIEEMII